MNFIVYSDDNPVPYKRTTQKQKWVDKEYKKYQAWKDKIVVEFVKSFKKYPHQVFKKKTKYYVNVMEYFKDLTHGDPDNIAKGVNDALFAKPLEDKYISGSYDYSYDKKNPRVEIEILDKDKNILMQKNMV